MSYRGSLRDRTGNVEISESSIVAGGSHVPPFVSAFLRSLLALDLLRPNNASSGPGPLIITNNNHRRNKTYAGWRLACCLKAAHRSRRQGSAFHSCPAVIPLGWAWVFETKRGHQTGTFERSMFQVKMLAYPYVEGLLASAARFPCPLRELLGSVKDRAPFALAGERDLLLSFFFSCRCIFSRIFSSRFA